MLTASHSDASGAEKKEVCYDSSDGEMAQLTQSQELDTATAILKKKKKPNSLM
jgi:hypothetical protein